MRERALDRVPILVIPAAVRGETCVWAIVADHLLTLSELERSSRARDQAGWPTLAQTRLDAWTVRQFCSPSYGNS